MLSKFEDQTIQHRTNTSFSNNSFEANQLPIKLTPIIKLRPLVTNCERASNLSTKKFHEKLPKHPNSLLKKKKLVVLLHSGSVFTFLNK